MLNEIFRQGGPYNIRRVGRDQYSLSIPMPTDQLGMTGRECPHRECSPGVFKVKPGTGITDGQEHAYCPYCRRAEDPNKFLTREQQRYLTDVVKNQATEGIERMTRNALGIGTSGKKKIGGGMFSMEISMKPGHRLPVLRPMEEQLRRDVTCPHCSLEHAVFGLAIWCPDCGEDIFLTHVEAECQVVRDMLNDVTRRGTEISPRVAARDIENALEDVVSILEAAMKALVRRKLLSLGVSPEEVDETFRKRLRNRMQGFDGCVEILDQLFSVDLTPALTTDAVEQFRHTLEKRHPITHNLGIVDRKYLENVRSYESEGRDVQLDEREVVEALDTVLSLTRHAHYQVFPR